MKNGRVVLLLTVLNAVLLGYLLTQGRSVAADTVTPVLRGQALEIVDAEGRVRASIRIHAADAKYKKADGKPYPETVMLRLIDAQGRPEVKIGGSEDGGAVGLIGRTDKTQVLLQADGAEAMLKLMSGDGRQQQIRP
jgi:hypothetical protein